MVDVCAGVIDCDYRGSIKVLLNNSSYEPFRVTVGERIAKLIVEAIHPSDEFAMVAGMNETDRGQNGFGSTGV